MVIIIDLFRNYMYVCMYLGISDSTSRQQCPHNYYLCCGPFKNLLGVEKWKLFESP